MKWTWKEDLKMKSAAYGKLFPSLYHKLMSSSEIKMGLFTLSMSIVLIFSLYIWMQNSTFEIFKAGFYYLIYFALFIPLAIVVINFKNFRLIKKYKGLKLNVHQNSMILLFIAYIQIYPKISTSNSDSLMRLYHSANSAFQDLYYGNWILIFISSLFYFAGFYSQIMFLKVLKKTKPYLKNFQNYA